MFGKQKIDKKKNKETSNTNCEQNIHKWKIS